MNGQPAAAAPAIATTVAHPEALTILGTYRCTAACEDCCFDSNPHVKGRLELDDILSFIREGARFSSCKVVVFSGGECFLLGADLVTAVEYATSLGLSTRCVTNGYWARSLEGGRTRLGALRRAGLKELNVSTGDFHQKWVPQESVVNAVRLSVELGLDNTVVMIELQRERRVTAASFSSDPWVAATLADSPSAFRIIESPWMPMNPRAVIEQDRTVFLNRGNLHLRGGCRSVLKTIVVTPQKRVGFCCGLSRERIPELNADWDGGSLDELLEAGSGDFMKAWLYVDGPDRILAWAAEKDPHIDWENRYAHHCHSCLALFSDPRVRAVIREHYRERVDDVLARFVVRLRQEQLVEQYA